MEKKKPQKSKMNTEHRKRKYVNTQSTLITHPTRLKILEALRSQNKSTRELEEQTNENRLNLYYHLNLLLEEKVIKIVNTSREKIYALETGHKKQTQVPLSIKLTIPTNSGNKKLFNAILKDLLKISKMLIPPIDPESLNPDNYSSVTLILE